MALYPQAVKRLLPENRTQPRIVPRMVIVHSTGGPTPKGLFGWWTNPASGGLECHFLIKNDGTVEQYMDTVVRADANGQANSYAISIETESTVAATERWNEAQATALVRLIQWCCTTHHIPRSITPTPTGSGLAWHVQFGAPGPWTGVRGKVCPGPARIEQFKNEIVPAVASGTNPPPLSKEFIMDKEAREAFNQIGKGLYDAVDRLNRLEKQVDRLVNDAKSKTGRLHGIQVRLDNIRKALKA